MNLDNRIELPDGRALAYAEFGQSDGLPVVYCHGSPGSRLEPLLIGDEVLTRAGLRVISPDRPGMGGSDFQPGRRIPDWPADLVCLADSLGLARFAMLGNSGGRMPITLFHGEADTNAPIAMARRAAAALPSATLITYPGEAHLSTLCNHFDEIARALAAPPVRIDTAGRQTR